MDDDAQAGSKRYSAIKIQIFLADLILTLILLLVFQLFLARGLSNLVFHIAPYFYFACFIFASFFLLFLYVASFPLHFINSFLVEKTFKLSTQNLKAWLIDEGKRTAIGFLLSICCILLFYVVLRNFPSYWWLISGIIWVFLSIILTRLVPVLIIPLFFKYLPIEGGPLKQGILDLARKADIRVIDVCKIDFSRKTVKANAALVGLGKTRKVILADTLIENFSLQEVENVVAHEFGHFKYVHIWKLLAFSGGMTLSGFFLLSRIAKHLAIILGASNLSELYMFPSFVIFFFLFSMFLVPLQNFFSRFLEREADNFALKLTCAPQAFISMMQKLASRNLADMNPPLLKKIFFYDHPPIIERIRMAEEMQISEGQK